MKNLYAIIKINVEIHEKKLKKNEKEATFSFRFLQCQMNNLVMY